jgi:hypothetical protein
MTYPAVPTPLTRRERQRELNPMRYQPMVNPVRIPEPTHTDAQTGRLSVTALALGLSSALFGFTILVPLAGIVFGVLGVGREPTRKRLAAIGIVTAVVFGIAWAAATPTLLDVLFP